VTQAYKDQMAEVRTAEEEERQREEAEKKKNGGMSTGMAHFYRKFLEDSEQKHEETVAATTSTQSKPTIGPQGPVPNLTITKPPELIRKSDVELAKEAREHGKDVELNDDNQIVDKRELLSAGLNLAAPNTRRLGLQKSSSTSTSVNGQDADSHRAVGTAASRKQINERREREIRQQMEEEQERMARAKELQDHQTTQRIAVKRNNLDDLQSARERYLERKRRKLEEAANSTQNAVDDPS